MRTAILQANHWHLRPHTAALKKNGEVELVALSGEGLLPREVSDAWGVPLYRDYIDLLDNENLDFVYIFGSPKQTPTLMKEAVRRGLPFIAEKPCAIDSEDLLPILQEAQRKRIVTSVPFGRRFAPIVERYKERLESAAQSGQLHLLFRYITGAPQRYVDLGCGWGLDPQEAGGGCFMNLGPHFIDLVRYITKDEICSVKAEINGNMWDTEVDDYAALVLRTAKGATATIEVGFTNPGKPYELYCMTGQGFYIAGEPGGAVQSFFGDGRTETFDFPQSDYYEECLEDMVLALKGLKNPKSTLEDAYHSLKIVNSAYRNAEVPRWEG